MALQDSGNETTFYYEGTHVPADLKGKPWISNHCMNVIPSRSGGTRLSVGSAKEAWATCFLAGLQVAGTLH